MKQIFINTDGGSRGNPGPAAIGIVFFDAEGKLIHSHKECIGKATNNEAEYRAIIKGLEILVKSKWFLENNDPESKVICRLDSKLVVEQVNGNFKIKQPHIQKFIDQIKTILSDFHLNIQFVHIPREENKEADKLVNEALDEQKNNEL